MLSIKNIKIENFRGVRRPLEINFVKGGIRTSAIIYGRNGTGKSSIVNAWEWFNNASIEDLNKEGVSANDYPHKACNGENCYVHVDFHHTSITGVRSTFDKRRITAPKLDGEHSQFRALSSYPNYLRYSDLQDFVYKTKTEKYKYIAKFFGLEEFIKSQTELQTLITRLRDKSTIYEKAVVDNSQTIKAITGKTVAEEVFVLEYINSIANKHSLQTVNSFTQIEKLKAELKKAVEANPTAKNLSEWNGFQTRLNQFYLNLTPVKPECEELSQLFKELKGNEENIKQLYLSALYEAGLGVLPKLGNLSICPLCDNPFDGDLRNHISTKHEAIMTLQEQKSLFDSKKTTLNKKVETIKHKIGVFESESSSQVLEEFKDFFNALKAINTELTGLQEILKPDLTLMSYLDFSGFECINTLDSIIAQKERYQLIVTEKVKGLSEDRTSKELTDDFENLFTIISAYTNFLIADKKRQVLNENNDNLQWLYETLTAFIQNEIQNTFTTISSDVVEYYNILEQSNVFLKNPVIKLLDGRNKAIELEIEFEGEKITPAFKFMSESQVNSFGLAIFLAAAKLFNNQFKFVILDDVVNSFDSYKRPLVVRLIADKFSDFQFLILTHDQIFFDIAQRNFPEWSRYKFTSWDYANGPKYVLAKNDFEEIQTYLDEDKPIVAGQTLGRYLEWVLGVLNESLKTPITYKMDNVFTLAELFNPFASRIKDKLKQAGKTHKLATLLNEFETTTIFRNYCAHWKNEPNSFTTPEIEAIFKKWCEIEELIYCPSCKSHISYDSQGSQNYVKCRCGSLNLKDENYYT